MNKEMLSFSCLRLLLILLLPLFAFSASAGDEIAGLERELSAAARAEKPRLLLQLAKKTAMREAGKKIGYAKEALRLAAELGDRRWEAEAMLELGFIYARLKRPLKAAEYGSKGLKIFQETGGPKEKAKAYVVMGIVYQKSSEPRKALEYFNKALKIWEELGDQNEMAEMRVYLGGTYIALGRDDRAVGSLLEAEKTFDALGKKNRRVTCFNTVAGIYNYAGKWKKALEYYEKVLKLAREDGDMEDGDMGVTASSLVDMGKVYIRLKDYDRAAQYHLEAIGLREKMGDKKNAALLTRNLAWVFFKNNDNKRSWEYREKALAAFKAMGDHGEAARTLLHMAGFFMKSKEYKRALGSLEEGMKFASKAGSTEISRDIYKHYAWAYRELGDYKTAYGYQDLYHGAANRILDGKSREEVEELRTGYDADSKETEIQLLQKDKKIRQLRLDNARISRDRYIAGLVMVFIILLLLFRKYLYLLAFWKRQKYIGGFRLLERVGSGAAGTVYRARGITGRSETAAVKILKDEWFSDKNTRERFKQEAVIIDKLEHENIVKIIERGEYKQRLFTAMEFLPGDTLERSIDVKGLFPMDRCLDIMVQVSEVVAFIHERDIVHRDLKPGNIMLVPGEGGRDCVKLLDFGLARAELWSRLTQSGNFVGTLEYMAPEQVMGGETLPANDIFSMGVTFYRLLCGESPFGGKTVVEIMGNLIKKEPLEVSVFRMDIPFELNFLVMMMLNKDPRQRPTAGEVRYDLGNLL